MKRGVYGAIATLIGVIIGAGILGIPYAVSKAGLITGLIDIVVIGLIILLLNLFVGELSLRTKGTRHQLTGYIGRYLGKKAEVLMTASMLVGIYGALLAYLIGEGEALAAIFGGLPLHYSLGFFFVASSIVYFGLRAVENSEKILVFGLLGVVLLLILLAFLNFNPENITAFDAKKIFLPYGVILFAFVGAAAIPVMREELRENRKYLKKAIIIGSIIPIIVYFLFALAIVSMTGLKTTEIATIGMGELLGVYAILLGNLYAILAMLTSFLALALALKEIYNYDYKINEKLSWLMTTLVPLGLFLILYYLNKLSFIKTIGITGAFAGGIDGILVVLALWVAKKKGDRKPEYSISYHKIIGAILLIIFILGIIDQAIRLF